MKQLKKIIIIDDDDRNIFALSAVLKAKGFKCISATSAQEGLQIINMQKDIGLALVDMMMPEMDGYEMMQKIRANPLHKHFPLIAVTAQAMVGDKEKCIEAGADDYISKPVDLDALVKIIQVHLNENEFDHD